VKTNNEILIIGGDSRQLYMSDFFEENGFRTSIYGLPEKKKKCSENLKHSIKSADIIVLPLPVTKDNKYLYSLIPMKETLDDIAAATSDKIIFGGMINRGTESKLKKNNNRVFDFFKREDITMLNAIPTAQGILKTMIDNIEYTIHSSKCAIFGFGRIARITAQVLKAIGADITICARKSGDIAAAKAYGYSGRYINGFEKEAHKFDILINTVPALIIKREILAKVKPDCLVIDVASAPFGTDFACAYELGVNVIQSSSLPGKVAPKTAGEIIGRGIINTLEEEFGE